jgi:pimeloyl-ACP methyl ester carboxylesterase
VNVREVRAGGRAIAVREWGDPAARPLLFWHALGPGHSGASFAVAAGPLAEAGFRVLAIDGPGFGRSAAVDLGDHAVGRLAELAWDVADALNADRCVVSGHSWGGSVAVFAAAAHLERTAALVLYDSGASDFADHPSVDLTATREQLIEAVNRDTPGLESWERLVALLRAEGLDQPWTLDAWREATTVAPDGSVTVRASPEVRGSALYEAMRARPSERWAALRAAQTPTLLVLATEPPEARETNERLLPRFLEAVPQADVVRPGCRHQVFADLGARAGELTAAWLRDQNLP